MRIFVFAACLATASALLPVSNAWASTKIETTRATVDEQCGKGKNDCFKSCGETKCAYRCEGKACTVTIFRKVEADRVRNRLTTGRTTG